MWREKKLKETLRHAATRAPFYREHWNQCGRTDTRQTWEDLDSWPILHKSSVRANPRRCACGRTLPILLSIDGRNDDVITARDGRQVVRLDPVFKGEISLHEAQIIQESLESIRVLIVPARGFAARHEQTIVSNMRQHLGDVHIQVELTNRIPAFGQWQVSRRGLKGEAGCTMQKSEI